MLLYRALTTGSEIAAWAGDSASSSSWASTASNLKTAINNNLWDAVVGFVSILFYSLYNY
jgi:hypothetical protein